MPQFPRDFAFPNGTFRYVIHGAATSGGPIPPLEMLDTVLEGTRRVLEFTARAAVESCLFVSSGAIYGPQPDSVSHLSESFLGGPDPTDRQSAYGEAKRTAELLCVLSELPVSIARCFAFVGPHLPLDAHFAAGNFLRDALHGGPIKVRGDGRTLRSYLYAADLMIWLWTILFRGKPGRAYNVGSEQPVTIAELARQLARLTSPACSIEIGPPNQGPAPRYLPDTSRARIELGLIKRISLDNALQRTFQWNSLS